MIIGGFNKTTLLDYPEHVAATIFTGGCNFRCPFCHNHDLVIDPASVSSYTEDEIISFLIKRKNILTGVCITGGEPTLQPDLKSFMKKIKDIGYLIKLDTNGYQPFILEDLCNSQLVDYIAMDIKNTPDKYAMTIGIPESKFDIRKIQASIDFIKSQSVDFEFRTTVVKELHTISDLVSIAKWLSPVNRYFLQSYQESENVIKPIFSSYETNDFQKIYDLILPIIPGICIRGVDGI